MKLIFIATVLVLSALVSTAARAEVSTPIEAPFDQLLEASRFIPNYKETAAVSARVFGARAQGSDKEYAAFMAKVAKADLTDLQTCLSRAYAAGPLTANDAEELVQIFRSPIGVRLLGLSQQMAIADIERGSHKQLDPSILTDSERRELALVYQKPVFARYSAFIISQTCAESTRTCLASSKVAKENGIKF
jgi:hypothetical protein